MLLEGVEAIHTEVYSNTNWGRDMVNFRLALSEEGKQRLDRAEAQRIQWAAMTDQELGNSLEYCMNNSAPPKWAPGEPVYDAVLWCVALPEAIKRLKGGKHDQAD
jgi:hypothetical protein